MLIHRVEISITAQTGNIWDWLLTMTNEKYRRWHRDHRVYVVQRPSDKLVGMRIWFDELLEGEFRICFSWEIVEAEPYKRVVFKALIPYAVYLELRLAQNGQQTLITHTLLIGKRSWYGRVVDLLIGRFIFTARRREILERHVREELKYLEQLVS